MSLTILKSNYCICYKCWLYLVEYKSTEIIFRKLIYFFNILELMVGEHVDESYEVSLSVSIRMDCRASLVFVIITILINAL